jgi:hypothetical protein
MKHCAPIQKENSSTFRAPCKPHHQTNWFNNARSRDSETMPHIHYGIEPPTFTSTSSLKLLKEGQILNII